MYRLILVIIWLGLVGSLFATGWIYKTDVSMSLTQNNYSNNWAGSELSSVSWVANSNTSLEKQVAKYLNKKTTLKLAFGQTHLQKEDANGHKYWATPEKTTDKIDLESVGKFTLQAVVDPFVSVRWESQFLDYSDTLKARILNPDKFTESVGLSRTFLKQDNQNLTTRLGAALRQTMDHEAWDATAMKRSTITTNDGGAEFVGEYNRNFVPQGISYKSRLQVYQAMYNSKKDQLPNDYWKAPDVTWENTLSTKLWSVVTMSLYFELLYEKQQSKAGQFKETMSLGVSYQLF